MHTLALWARDELQPLPQADPRDELQPPPSPGQTPEMSCSPSPGQTLQMSCKPLPRADPTGISGEEPAFKGEFREQVLPVSDYNQDYRIV